jgi:hypothetical protein
VYLDRFLNALTYHWRSVEAHFTSEAAIRFRVLLAQLMTGAVAEQVAATDELAEMMTELLPDGHPVRSSLSAETVTRSIVVDRPAGDVAIGDRPADHELIAELQRLLEPHMWRLFGPREQGQVLRPEQIADEAEARLLSAPALSADEVRGRGGDPGHQYLIRLDSMEGDRFPAFQFDAAGQPILLVLHINELLEADDDPWGVADWWLGRHSWFSQTPAESIGEVSDEVLLASARTLVEGG